MRRWRLKWLPVIILMYFLILSCATGPEKAKDELTKMDITFTENSFVQKAREGDVGAIRLFLKAGMDPNVSDAKDNTALIVAAKKGHTEIVKLLLENGADIEGKDPKFARDPSDLGGSRRADPNRQTAAEQGRQYQGRRGEKRHVRSGVGRR